MVLCIDVSNTSERVNEMKYCEECNIVTKDNVIMCPHCKRDILKSGEPQATFPITVVRVSGFEYQRICGALESENIPYSAKTVKKKFANNAVTGKTNAEYDVLVPYQYYAKTFELLVGINAINPDDADFEDKFMVSQKSETLKEFDGEDYYSTKNKVIRLLSVVLMLALVAGVVFGVDAIVALIKNMLN